MTQITVMIADDHPLIVEGLTSVLARHDLNVVGSAKEASAVVDALASLHPDVLVLDLRFGDGDIGGLDVLQQLQDRGAAVKVVVYTQFDQDEVVREAYKRGAKAFVTKNIDPSELAETIVKVHRGETVFLPSIATRLALMSVRGDESPLSKLQPREVEVFKLMAQGLTNVEIASLLNLSPKTISTTSQSIKDHLGIHRPADITLLAVRCGLIEP
ncbi:response regulator transcription factor [Aquabacterium sp. CECT 9606]|uniref:response regulator transcription factor n=1 Tax=Aquabacterium sp. CECT 9606 TaxID=2845822 RepID=UPI001E3DCCC4|nr:response regulator transcription factor [Aquabacterium sp. CECT 9606]CAH0350854.1 Response regulator GacA [Aquabacterium sp. CECT 9606]